MRGQMDLTQAAPPEIGLNHTSRTGPVRCILQLQPGRPPWTCYPAVTATTTAGAHMTQNPGKPACPADLRALDLFEFAQSRRQAAGGVRVSQLPRMLNEVPADAPDHDTVFSWQAEGSMKTELPTDGNVARQQSYQRSVHRFDGISCI